MLGENMRVLPIKYEETKDWLLHVHYLHRMPQIKYAFGLFEDQQCLGIVTFGLPASPSLCKGICGPQWSRAVLELNRMCFVTKVENGNSFLVSKAIKQLPKPSIIISYADTKFGHVGKVYQSCNFIYTGITKQRTDGSTKEGCHARHNPDYSTRVERSAKHRYVFVSASKGDRKKILRDMNYKICEYPTGTPSRYEITYKPSTQNVLF
jgi:hypothetical protein